MSRGDLLVKNLQFLDCGPYSFSLNAGECIGISGASGVGKTQLLRTLSDLIPSTGVVSFFGKRSCDYRAVEWRKRVSMLPTDSVWWYETVGAHFKGGGKPFFHKFCEELGFSRDVSKWQVSRLSTGEKQRLALLRSLQFSPAILLLDEPTSALDGVNVTRVENFLLSLKRD